MEATHLVLSLPVVCVRLLGPLEVSRRLPDGSWQVVGRKVWGNGTPPRSVFKRLLTTPGRRLSRLDIQEDLWPDASMELADHYLNNAVTVIRHVIGRQFVETIGSLYEIAGQSQVWTDLDACVALLKEVENRGRTTPEALPLLEEILSYCERGKCLEDEGEKWCHAVRADAERMCRQCRLWLAEAYERADKLWQAGEQYRAMARTTPPDEDALQGWIVMLARHGKTQEALICYRDTKTVWETQGFMVSSALETLTSEVERQHRDEAPQVLLSLAPQPEKAAQLENAVSLWQPDSQVSENFSRVAIWPAFSQEEMLADNGKMLYDGLEVEIMAMTLQWKRSSGSISVLQQLIYEAIKKHDAMHKNCHDDHDTKITRRHALQAIALFPLHICGLTQIAAQARILPGEEDILPLCAAGIAACWELLQYEPDGLLVIERVLAAYLPPLEKLARRASHVQTVAAALASQGYLLVSTLAEYASRLDRMEAACLTARLYGQFAGDLNLEVVALSRLAGKFDYEHRDVKSMQMYEEAQALPGFDRVSSMLQGRIYVGLAATHAYCKQISLALSLLEKAREIYPVHPEVDPCFPFAGNNSGPYSFAVWEGLVLKHTNCFAEATSAFLRFGNSMPQPGLLDTVRAEHLNYTASVAVKERNLDAAAQYLDAAEEVAWRICHVQRHAEVRETLRDMQLLWPDEPKVKVLREKIYERQRA